MGPSLLERKGLTSLTEFPHVTKASNAWVMDNDMHEEAVRYILFLSIEIRTPSIEVRFTRSTYSKTVTSTSVTITA